MNKLLALAAFFTSFTLVMAANYDVGPGQPLAMLQSVPWAALQPGDVVNIHHKPGGYHEKFQISASGTAAQHIVIRGIPDPTTKVLPIIDGKDAIEDPAVDYRSSNFAVWGVIVVSPRNSTYVYGAYHVSYVDIESLDIRNATYSGDGSITFTDQHGIVKGYDTFACGIYIEWAHDLAVRGCEISNCGNGLFANSKNQANQSSQRLLIEKNYFHDNSNPVTPDPANPGGPPLSNGFGEHHIYVESAGSIIQYNRFGKHRPGAHGIAIKDRSSGQIIRYNEFDIEEQSNVFGLLDPQGGIDFIQIQPDYLDSFVYGNIITIENYATGINAFWWGSFNGPGLLPDKRSSYATLHRRTLYFFNNTVICHHNGVGLFFLPSTTNTGAAYPTYENVDCRNNIFYCDSTIQASSLNAMHFYAGGTANGGGDITLGTNWISTGWLKDAPGHTYTGSLIGTANLLVGDASGANNPHFVDINAHDYHVLSPCNILDGAGALAAAALPANAVTLEYLYPSSFQPRIQQSTSMDLGALESTGLATPPPPGGALQFNTGSYSQSEAGGTATITVTRVGGTLGSVSVTFATTAGGTALDGSDYASVVGTLSWADGESASKTFAVPIFNDTEIELAETIKLSLSNPTGDSALGTLATATLTVQDNDTPQSTLMYGLGHTTNALFLFRSGTPGSPLSFSIPSGLVAGDALRALAVHPLSGTLYAVGTASVIYTMNPFTGVATAIGPAFTPAVGGDSMDLTFDRIAGTLRLITATNQNLRISAVTGQVLSNDTTLAFTAGDANFASVPQLAGTDYALTGGMQTLFGFDSGKDAFVRIGSVGGAPQSVSTGQVTTIGSLGFDTAAQAGLKIPAGAAYAFACISLPVAAGASSSSLFAINLNKGNAISLGTIRPTEYVCDIAIASAHDIWKHTRFTSNAGSAATAGDDADPDHNGVSNLMEYALGVPAINSAPVTMPIPERINNRLTLTFFRPVTATEIIYTVQVSANLTDWQDGSNYAVTGDTPNNAFTSQLSRSIANGIETITVQDNTDATIAPQHFIRLKVTAW